MSDKFGVIPYFTKDGNVNFVLEFSKNIFSLPEAREVDSNGNNRDDDIDFVLTSILEDLNLTSGFIFSKVMNKGFKIKKGVADLKFRKHYRLARIDGVQALQRGFVAVPLSEIQSKNFFDDPVMKHFILESLNLISSKDNPYRRVA